MKNTTEKKKQFQKVKIVWRDAVSHADWLNPEDVKKYKPYINVSEGFLLEKNKNATIVLDDSDYYKVKYICKKLIQNNYLQKISEFPSMKNKFRYRSGFLDKLFPASFKKT